MSRHTLVAPDTTPCALVDEVDPSPVLARQAGRSLQSLPLGGALAGNPRAIAVFAALVDHARREGDGVANLRTAPDASPLPESIARLLVSVLTEVSQGHGVTVVRTKSDLSTTQAAKLLGCSRPHFAKLLAHGVLPSYAVGAHRRVALADVLAYQRIRAERAAGLKELSEISALFSPEAPPAGTAPKRPTPRAPRKKRHPARRPR